MKKIICLSGILAMLAGFVTSCNKDESDNDEKKAAVKKQLVKMVDIHFLYEFVYDNEGKCTSYIEYHDETISEKVNYKYEGNTTIEECCLDDGTVRVTTTMTYNSNGYLESEDVDNGGDTEKTVYTYNDLGQLISSNTSDPEGYSASSTYTWENGNVTKVHCKEVEDEYEYEYDVIYNYTNTTYTTPIENKAGLSIHQIINSFRPHYSKMGVATKSLPVSIAYEYNGIVDRTDTMDWTLDGYDYPTKMILKSNKPTNITELTWK